MTSPRRPVASSGQLGITAGEAGAGACAGGAAVGDDGAGVCAAMVTVSRARIVSATRMTDLQGRKVNTIRYTRHEGETMRESVRLFVICCLALAATYVAGQDPAAQNPPD